MGVQYLGALVSRGFGVRVFFLFGCFNSFDHFQRTGKLKFQRRVNYTESILMGSIADFLDLIVLEFSKS